MDKVTFHLLPIGGAFGRRLPDLWNFLTYAVNTASRAGRAGEAHLHARAGHAARFLPPQRHEPLQSGVNAEGMPVCWVNDYTTDDDANDERISSMACPTRRMVR